MTPSISLHHIVFSLACVPWAHARSQPCVRTQTCKSYPGSADWPSTESWGRLNESLGGRLLQPTPPGAACHPGQAAYDPDRCAAVAEEWSDFDFHVADPVSVMWDNFSNDACLPNPAHVCRPDGYPAFVVNATTAEHVKLGINFARENNVRLVVKSTGHDYLGRSIAPGSLSIWTHHMQDILYHEGEFKPTGSDVTIEGSAVTVGGGVQMHEVQQAMAKYNQTVVGGGCGTVSVGGYTAGGGHSLLSPRFGLAADNVLQMEVVTPKGETLTINEAQNTDLFWAMRGGGGSTFGVATSITFSTHPSPSISQLSWAFTMDPGSAFFGDVLAYILSQFPTLEKAGMSMYTTSQSELMTPAFPIPGLPSEIAGVMGVSLLQDNTDPDVMDKLWGPINETISERWPGVSFVSQPREFASWADWFSVNQDPRPVGGSILFASRLLDEEALTRDLDALADAVKMATDSVGRLTNFLVSGKGVHEAKPRGGGNAAHPAWRKAYVHSIATKKYPSFNATAEEETISALAKAVEGLKKLTPHTGSYINEASIYEEDWQTTFWGANYDRLLRIKKAVDPDDVFWCRPCVGSEGWEQGTDGRLCKV